MSILKNISFAALLLLLWTSCSKEDDSPIDEPKPEKEYFGYAHGMMNGEAFSIDNDVYPKKGEVGAVFTINNNWDHIGVDSIAEVGINMLKQHRYVYMQLWHWRIGTFFADDSDPTPSIYTEIGDGAFVPKVRYRQRAEHPTRIDLTRVEYRYEWGGEIPAIEGILNGVFYNTADPKDSIVLEDVAFGIH